MKSYNKKVALAILLAVVSETLTDVIDEKIARMSPLMFTSFQKFQRDLKRMIAEIVSTHRRKIYDELSSESFIRKYPVMKKVLKLPVSNMKKSIIFLSGIGCTTAEISHILQCEKCSVSAMRSACRHHISEIFRH